MIGAAMDWMQPLDIGSLEATLHCRGMEEPAGLAWLEASWRHPVPFWEGLLAGQDRLVEGQRKSVAFQHYDLFHDLASRFAKHSTPAMVQPAVNGAVRVLTYPDLTRRAARLAERWRTSGARPEQIVALLVNPGEELAVALLAAFRLGLVISLLPPRGRSFLRRRLATLKPDYVVMDPLHSSLLAQGSQRVLDWEEEGGMAESGPITAASAVYPAGSTAGLLFDPCAQDGHLPKPVTAEALYLGAVRDGLLALGLRPGDAYAVPGFEPLETEPCLLLAGLVNGATRVELAPDSLEEHPELLATQPLKVLGLSRRVRDLLLRKPVDLSKITSHWFRHPGDTVDLAPWQRLAERLGLKEAFAANLAWNSALGGCYLCSPRRRGIVHNQVLPAAGCPWHLGQLPDGETPALGTVGLLVAWFPNVAHAMNQKEQQSPPGRTAPVLLSKHGNQWFCTHAPHCGKYGLFYPVDEVRAAAAAALPRGLHCALVTVPPHGVQDDPQQVMLVFTAASADDEAGEELDPAQLSTLVRQAVTRETGAPFVPDQVKLLPLFPRFDEEARVDDEWCAEQYLAGRLQRKANDPMFLLLARIQGMFG